MQQSCATELQQLQLADVACSKRGVKVRVFPLLNSVCGKQTPNATELQQLQLADVACSKRRAKVLLLFRQVHVRKGDAQGQHLRMKACQQLVKHVSS